MFSTPVERSRIFFFLSLPVTPTEKRTSNMSCDVLQKQLFLKQLLLNTRMPGRH